MLGEVIQRVVALESINYDIEVRSLRPSHKINAVGLLDDVFNEQNNTTKTLPFGES